MMMPPMILAKPSLRKICMGAKFLFGLELDCTNPVERNSNYERSWKMYITGVVDEVDVRGVKGMISVMFQNGHSGKFFEWHLDEIDIRKIPDDWDEHILSSADRAATEQAVRNADLDDNNMVVEID
jgi:hypothetical protein